MGKSCWSCCCCWSRSCWGVGRAAAAGRWSAETGLAEEAEAAATGAFAATAVVFVVAVTDAGATACAEAAATFAAAGDGAGAVCFLGEKRERERAKVKFFPFSRVFVRRHAFSFRADSPFSQKSTQRIKVRARLTWQTQKLQQRARGAQSRRGGQRRRCRLCGEQFATTPLFLPSARTRN